MYSKGENCKSILLDIENAVREHTQRVESIFHTMRRDDNQVIVHSRKSFRKMVSDFSVRIRQSFLQEMQKWFLIFCEDSSQSAVSVEEVKLEDIVESILHDLHHLVRLMKSRQASRELVEELEGNKLCLLVDTVTEEIKLNKVEASKPFHSMRLLAKVHNIADTDNRKPSAGEIPLLDDEAKTIINVLTRGTKQLDICCIVGMPGLGKTTLAKKVYSDPPIILHFHVRSWCCVSQVYKRRILSGMTDDTLDETGDDLAAALYKYLKGKKYLIILDDLWDTSVWDNLKCSFPDDANGSRNPYKPRFLERSRRRLRKGSLSILDQCLNTLELSYSHSPDYLKPCLLYFGAFHLDQNIRVRDLLWLWIAEGFVEKSG
ncbi:OLC1v1019122C1 [Oldenlandia corymbosa var. corymbosa]|uniref:OLC1v1019122C1 n=1 Tax=Oldenlandia corymbosa var. corymbosa TaxID=529605 RepID=A0AAV1EDA0_OLDCO|nr:OLC1v1019122C1 [Oldenlandia corymbosa var. corymbosa]